MKTAKLKRSKKSAIHDLPPEKYFYITLIADVLDELVNEQIITPTQRWETKQYMAKKMDDNRKNKNK